MALEFRWLTLSTGYWAVVICFYFTSLWFRCIYSISRLRRLPVNIPRILSLYIYIPCHSLERQFFFFFFYQKKKKNEAISMKPCTSTYKGDLCHFGVTDGSGIVWQRVDTFQHLDFSTFRFLLLTWSTTELSDFGFQATLQCCSLSLFVWYIKWHCIVVHPCGECLRLSVCSGFTIGYMTVSTGRYHI